MILAEEIKRYFDNAEYERTHGYLQGCLEFKQLEKLLKELRAYRKICHKEYENYLKKSEVVISQLRADRDRLLKAFDDMKSEIEKLQTYKMFIGEKTVYVERDDVLAIIDKHRGESEK
jgi:hypothetical protein